MGKEAGSRNRARERPRRGRRTPRTSRARARFPPFAAAGAKNARGGRSEQHLAARARGVWARSGAWRVQNPRTPTGVSHTARIDHASSPRWGASRSSRRSRGAFRPSAASRRVALRAQRLAGPTHGGFGEIRRVYVASNIARKSLILWDTRRHRSRRDQQGGATISDITDTGDSAVVAWARAPAQRSRGGGSAAAAPAGRLPRRRAPRRSSHAVARPDESGVARLAAAAPPTRTSRANAGVRAGRRGGRGGA
jgi:hypothetical protein